MAQSPTISTVDNSIFFIKTLSYTKSICEESVKDIKDNWKPNSTEFQHSRRLYNLVKAESDSWIAEFELFLLVNQAVQLNMKKNTLAKVNAASSDFHNFYQIHAQNKPILISRGGNSDVPDPNMPPPPPAVFGKKHLASPTVLDNISEVQTQKLIVHIRKMKLQSWGAIFTNSAPTTTHQPIKSQVPIPPPTVTEKPKAFSPIAQTNSSSIANPVQPSLIQPANLEKTTPTSTVITQYLDLSVGMPTQQQYVSDNAVSFAIASVLEYHLQKKDTIFSKKNSISSDYIHYNTSTSESRTYLLDGLDFVKEKGTVTVDTWNKSLQMPGVFDWTKVDFYSIKNYELLYNKHHYNEAELSTIIRSGINNFGPLIAEIKLFGNALYMDNTGNAVIEEGNADSYQYFQTVVIVGYDEQQQLFKFLNNKGSDWGKKGYAYFPYDYVQKHLKYLYALIYPSSNKDLVKN